MGKLGPRLDSRKLARRWPKGQSSSSNPQTRKHRDQASRMFFVDTTGEPGLTRDDLKKHDAMQGLQPEFEKLDLANDEIESNLEGTANSADTFASNYSNCSNISFNRFLNHFQSQSLLHKEMLAVLSAVTEIIKQNGGTETSTEYFAALMSTLEAVESETSIAATLSLLGMGLKTVPKNVLNVQFGAASKIFLDILTKYAASDDFLILRHCIHCLSILLRALEIAAWSDPSSMQVLDAILSFITYGKPKVRKSAQHGVCAILKGSEIMKGENPPQHHPASPQIAKHCIAQLDIGSEPGGVTSVLHVLVLLKDITHQLPKAHVKTICESLLKLMGLKNILITSCCLQTMHGLFISRPTEEILPSQRNAQIITALYDYQPPMTDTQPTLAWLTVMQEAHINLAKTSLNTCSAVLPKLFMRCMQLWLSDRNEIVASASHTIKTILQDCLGPMCNTEINAHKYANSVEQIIVLMHSALSYQYIEAWYHILHLISLLFEITGKSGNPKLLDIIKTLADLHESPSFSSKSDAEYAIGAAIRSMGPETVLNTIPIMVTPEVINLKRGWMLPLLKDCIIQGTLSFFVNTLLPIATLAEKKAGEATIAGKTYAFLVPQVWSILPSICQNATDVKENFRNIAKMLGTALGEKKDLRLAVQSALRKLITKAVENKNEGDISELSKFAKNYLPILLNLYTTKSQSTYEEGQRKAAFSTIAVYLSIASPELVSELFDRAFARLNESKTDPFFVESIHDIMTLLMEYVDAERLKTYFDMCVPCLKDTNSMKEQKKAYRFFEELCASEKETCKEFVTQHRREIQRLLTQAAAVVQKPCRGARLKCLTHLVNMHPQLEGTKFLQSIVPEAVLYIKDLNTKCRTAAFHLLNCIAEKFLNNEENLKEYVDMITAGLLGTPKYCSASLLALASITYHYNGSLGVQTIKDVLEHACTLAVSKTREIVESALAYIKVYITIMPSPIVAGNLKQIMQTLANMEKDCELHFRQKVRDILVKFVRKYGFQTITGLVSPQDTILRKRLKNINRIEEAKKKNKEMQKTKDADKDEDEEFNAKRRPKSMEEILADSEEECDEEGNEPKKNKKRTSRKEAWIQENEEDIVDLADPLAARNISTTQPTQANPRLAPKKVQDRGFKTAPDGRLIISEDNEKDDTEKVGRKKRKAPFLHSDSEDDYENDDTQSVMTTNSAPLKRKHSGQSDTMSVRSQGTSRYQAGGSGIHRPLKKARNDRSPGAEYRAPKAGGDVKKKGKPEPYAYLPLTRSSLNKRKKKKNATKINNVIKAAKKGATAGMRQKKRK